MNKGAETGNSVKIYNTKVKSVRVVQYNGLSDIKILAGLFGTSPRVDGDNLSAKFGKVTVQTNNYVLFEMNGTFKSVLTSSSFDELYEASTVKDAPLQTPTQRLDEAKKEVTKQVKK